MKKFFLVLVAFGIISMMSVSCKRTEVKYRCCKNDFEIITQNYQTPDSFTLFIPQVFTPNADNVNDQFFPMGVGWKVEHMVVKKGRKSVFESTNYLESFWDGGTEEDGQFKYEITFRTDVGDLLDVKGEVCLMRFGARGDKLPELEREKICECITEDMIDSSKGPIFETTECPTNSALQ